MTKNGSRNLSLGNSVIYYGDGTCPLGTVVLDWVQNLKRDLNNCFWRQDRRGRRKAYGRRSSRDSRSHRCGHPCRHRHLQQPGQEASPEEDPALPEFEVRSLPIAPYFDFELIRQQNREWRKRCLSLFSDLEVEMDRITHLVDSMPLELKTEIEEMLTRSQRQKAVTRLTQIDTYAEELTILSGNLAKQMVRKIEKRMKNL